MNISVTGHAKFKFTRWLITGLAGICSLLVSSDMLAGIEGQRATFVDASRALSSNQITKYNRLLKKLGDYPLKAYLEYDAIKRRLRYVSNNEMRRFLESHEDYPFNYHLRASWLSVLAKRKDWSSYLSFYDNRNNTRLRCLAFQARISLGDHEKINEEIKNVWLRGYSQPKECDIAFDHLLDSDVGAYQLVWQRVDKAFDAGQPNLGRYLGKKLIPVDQSLVETWYKADRKPEKSLKLLAWSSDTPIYRKIIVHAIDRLARKNCLRAKQIWSDLESRFAFNDTQKTRLALRIALSAAYQREPMATQLLSDLPLASRSSKTNLLLARIHLRDRNWQGLIDTIEQMPDSMRLENDWQYWLARSYEALGFDIKSNDKFVMLSHKSSYYGFLAADKLQLPYRIEQENSVSDTDHDAEHFLAENPYLLRARELYLVDRQVDANREWFQALKYFETHQIKQAAVLASSWEWHDRAIKTLARIAHRRDYKLRFPMPFKQLVFDHADAKQLDPSLIYGLMRRESLFDPMAKSGVGALGLMQLMPATARGVAKSLGLGRPGQSDILQIGNNINFGTQYFRSVLDRFENNIPLAAAAYNAGPHRVKKWLPQDNTVPADLWVETVPFKETRKYVKAILAYATVFDRLLGRGTLISSRMDDIKSEY